MKRNLTLVSIYANDVAQKAQAAYWYKAGGGDHTVVLIECIDESFEKLAAALGYSITPIPDELGYASLGPSLDFSSLTDETPTGKDETQ